MDYRDRKYYMVTLNNYSHNSKLKNLKATIPTLKIYSPYNHFKNHKGYDGDASRSPCFYCQMVISCGKSYSDILETELTNAGSVYTRFWELDKVLLGQ